MTFMEVLEAAHKYPGALCVIYRKDCDALYATINDQGEIQFNPGTNPYLADFAEFDDWEIRDPE